MVNGGMKTSPVRPRAVRSNAARRARLLAAFDRSGLSAADFARQHGLNYTTFCGWRQRHAKTNPSPGFVQVELHGPTAPAPAELVVEFSAQVRLRRTSSCQMDLAARLIQALNSLPPC